MSRPDTLAHQVSQPSMRERVLQWLESAAFAADKSPKAQTRKASDEINGKVIKAKERAGLLIRIDPQILELVGYSMIVLAAEQMEAQGKHAGARFDLMKDAAQKTRATFITKHFTDESLRQQMIDQNHDRQIASEVFRWFYHRNPRQDEIFGHLHTDFLLARRALEDLFRAAQTPVPPQI